MFCETCTEAVTIHSTVGSKNTFLTGCKFKRVQSVKLHEESANHIKAIKVVFAKHNPRKTTAYKIKRKLTKPVTE